MSTTQAPPPEQPSSRLAEDLTRRLIKIVTLGSDGPDTSHLRSGERFAEEIPYESIKTDIYTADVEDDMVRFSRQVSWMDRFGVPVPCLLAGEGDPIPIAFPDLFHDWPFRRMPPYLFFEDFYYALRAGSFVSPNVKTIEVGASEATSFIQTRLVSFLTARFNARQSDISQSPGLQFTVNTKSDGLRVHYSPAYFFDGTNVLNSPTSPVTGWIQPGRYIFGAGRLGTKPDFDFDAEYDIPPHRHADLSF